MLCVTDVALKNTVMHAGSTDTIIGRCGRCEGGAGGGMRRRGHGGGFGLVWNEKTIYGGTGVQLTQVGRLFSLGDMRCEVVPPAMHVDARWEYLEGSHVSRCTKR